MGPLSIVSLTFMSCIVLLIAEQPFNHCTCRGRVLNCRRRYFYRYRIGNKEDATASPQEGATPNGSVPRLDVQTICPGATDVQLSNLNLRAFPGGLDQENITKIDLSGNLITALPDAGMLGPDVKRLDLSANAIEGPGAEAEAEAQLRPLGALEELLLGWNRLRHLSFLPAPCRLRRLQLTVNFIDRLDGGWLRRCALLESLTLLANNVSALPAGAFAGLGHLRQLTLSMNPVQELSDRAFDGLSQLESLRMKNTRLATLPNNAFASLRHLDLLELSDNPFASLPPHAFRGLVNLRSLDLNNALHNVTLNENLFSELRNLRKLFLGRNSLTFLPNNIFHQQNLLEELHLQSNLISHVSENTFTSLRNLKVLRLDRNHFAEMPGSIICNLPLLQELQMPYNRLTTLPDLAGCQSLRTANFFNNSVAAPSEALVRAALARGPRDVGLEGNPVRASSLRWVLRAGGVEAFALDCACGGVRSRSSGAEVRFCVVAPCGPPSPFVSWMEAVAAAN
ncbi:hypothetical protein R5R35_013251 [Gryllus longicercus]|uniref:Uncharacterized protein n=1 Tax=Gryllus longicercus TaxID=2509291 RepID=A0AAN9ZIM8_9ORTH